MGRILLGVVLTVASFLLVQSLTCNKCDLGINGICLAPGEQVCPTNTSVCYTGEATFGAMQDLGSFSSSGCKEPPGCNMTSNGTLLETNVGVTIRCCETDRCNPFRMSSGAPAATVTLSATLGVAGAALLWTRGM